LARPLPFDWPHDDQEAAALLKKLTNHDIEADILNNGDDVAIPSVVETFTFAQLERNKIYLVAAVDGSGRQLFYGTAFAYCESPELCTTGVVYDAPPHNYAEELVDLDGNGVDVIIAKDLAGGYEGYASMPVYNYKIYKVIGGRAVDVSTQYKTYYDSTLLPKMKADLTRARAMFPDKKDQDIVEALGALAQDDYARRILKEPAAGLDHAKTWGHSSNHRLQDYALMTLRQIDSPAADALLTDLSNSQDERMAKAAARELEIHKSVRENERLKQALKSQKQ
jgi:hypothetical protein